MHGICCLVSSEHFFGHGLKRKWKGDASSGAEVRRALAVAFDLADDFALSYFDPDVGEQVATGVLGQ